ncbi:MAG: pentapeptide repeat-containing protein [Bacteroidota bacterium]
MKKKRNFLVAILLGGILGWVLGYLRFPYLDTDFSFFLGFITCLTFIALVFWGLNIWKKNKFLLGVLGENKNAKPATKSYLTLWALIAAFIFTGGIVSSYLFFQQNKWQKEKADARSKTIKTQFDLTESARKINAAHLINNLAEKIEEEVHRSDNNTLTDRTLARLVALNHSFQPYAYWEGDSLSAQKLSPERGQLLLVLVTLDLDTTTFRKIKKSISFLGADLRGTDLSGKDLSGMDLRAADFRDANLSETRLVGTDLRSTNFWGANLNKAIFRKADLKRANMSWAELNDANLDHADLDDANLSAAQLRRASLNEARLRWGNMNGAILSEASLYGMDLLATDLSQANCNKTNLEKANLRWAVLNNTTFTEANFTDIVEVTKAGVIEKNWLEKLTDWKVIGAEAIQKEYQLVEEKTTRCNFILEKAEKQ